jgi:elongation factor G
MKEYTTEAIRNIVLASHSSSGKTILCEAFLNFTGATTRMGKIEDGSTISDFDDEEKRRGISLSTSVIPVEYNGIKINFLDTPGYTDFVGEVVSALRVADGMLVLVDSVAGLEVGTEVAWRYGDLFKLPRFLVVNKMERENANFKNAVASVQKNTETRLINVQIPWGEKAAFQGVIDVLTMKAYKDDGKTASEIPAEFQSAAEEARQALIEAAAEGEDALLEKYLENGTLSDEEVTRGLKNVVRNGTFVPVFCSSGQHLTGVGRLLDAIQTLMPSPSEIPAVVSKGKDGEETLVTKDNGPLAVYVWKTTADPFVGKLTYFRVYSGMMTSDSRVWNQTRSIEERLGGLQLMRGKEVIPMKAIHSGDIGIVPKLSETSTTNTLCDKAHPQTLPIPSYPNALYQVSINPKTQADSTKISPTMTRLCEEDMTLSWHMEPSTNQTILQGMGDQHIDVAIRRAEAKFQVFITMEEPRVPYTETITRKGQAMYRHKKQTGGSGQFGEVHLRVEPLPEEDFEFTNEVVGGSVSSSYMPAIEKGIRATMKEGILAGFPVQRVKIAVFDGKEHPVDSKPIAFEIAGREAFKLAFMEAGPALNEPIMLVKITVPEEHMGDIMGDLNTRRARIQGMASEKGNSIVTATVPLVEMLRYTTQLRSMTGGRGYFEMQHDHYEVVPSHLTSEIIAAHQKELAAKKEA